MITTLFSIFVASCAGSLLVTPVVRKIASRCGLVDRPDGRRKLHGREIPLGGGIALILTSVVVVAGASVLSPMRDELLESSRVLLGMMAASLVICGVGVVDDYRGLRGRYKVLGQLASIAIVMACGVTVHDISLFGWHVQLGILAAPFTVFFLLGAINSLNLLDGMDGLLSSVGLIICVAIACTAAIGAHWASACVAAALAGALLGFLRYNFPPASIFLGDCGSMLLGLVAGVLAIQASVKGPTTVALATPIAILTLPILDSLAAVLRRTLTGRSIFSTDRGHLHHCLLRRGLSPRGVLLYISLFGLLAMSGALVSVALKNELVALISTLVVAGILILTRLFGYSEFLLVKNRLVATAASLLHKSSGPRHYHVEVRLQGTAGWDAMWAELTAFAEQSRFVLLELNVNAPWLHEGYHARWDRRNGDHERLDSWQVQIPLLTDGRTLGRLTVAGQWEEEPPFWKISDLAQFVEELSQGALASAGQTKEPATVVSAVDSESPLAGEEPAEIAASTASDSARLSYVAEGGNGHAAVKPRRSHGVESSTGALRPKRPR